MNQTTLFNQRIALIKQHGEGRVKASFAIVGNFPELTPYTRDVLLFTNTHEVASSILAELELLKSELPAEQQTEINVSIKTVWAALGETEELTNVKLETKWFGYFVNYLRSIQQLDLLASTKEYESKLKSSKKFKDHWVEQGLPFHFCAAYYAASEALMTDDEKNNPDLIVQDWAASKVIENLHHLIRFRYLG